MGFMGSLGNAMAAPFKATNKAIGKIPGVQQVAGTMPGMRNMFGQQKGIGPTSQGNVGGGPPQSSLPWNKMGGQGIVPFNKPGKDYKSYVGQGTGSGMPNGIMMSPEARAFNEANRRLPPQQRDYSYLPGGMGGFNQKMQQLQGGMPQAQMGRGFAQPMPQDNMPPPMQQENQMMPQVQGPQGQSPNQMMQQRGNRFRQMLGGM